MKYIAFRIDTSAIKNYKTVKGYFVRGQKNTDYNWDMLGEFDCMDGAKRYIKSVLTNPKRQRIYGPDGYGLQI